MDLQSSLHEDKLAGFESISLEDMGKVKLMNRIDTKYVTTINKIDELLKLASPYYLIQQTDGKRNMPYYTCYYDTPDDDMYYQHQRGKKTRQKIRRRVYEGSDNPVAFLEVKSKNNKGRTRKKRVLMEEGENLPLYIDFIENHSDYHIEHLIPKIENHFFRITLVNQDLTERITIDTDLEFHNFETDARAKLSDLGIIEWKRDGTRNESVLKEILYKLRIHERGFSKYCIGRAMTDPALKQNRIKKRLRYINKINQFK